MFSTHVHNIWEATSLHLQLAKLTLLSLWMVKQNLQIGETNTPQLQTKRRRYSKAFQVTYSIQSEELVRNENDDRRQLACAAIAKMVASLSSPEAIHANLHGRSHLPHHPHILLHHQLGIETPEWSLDPLLTISRDDSMCTKISIST